MKLFGKYFLIFQLFSSKGNDHGSSTDQNLTLNQRLEIEKTTFHWYPYKRILYHQLSDGTEEEECLGRPQAIDEFPKGWWTRKCNLKSGFYWFHFFWIINLINVYLQKKLKKCRRNDWDRKIIEKVNPLIIFVCAKVRKDYKEDSLSTFLWPFTCSLCLQWYVINTSCQQLNEFAMYWKFLRWVMTTMLLISWPMGTD